MKLFTDQSEVSALPVVCTGNLGQNVYDHRLDTIQFHLIWTKKLDRKVTIWSYVQSYVYFIYLLTESFVLAHQVRWKPKEKAQKHWKDCQT